MRGGRRGLRSRRGMPHQMLVEAADHLTPVARRKQRRIIHLDLRPRFQLASAVFLRRMPTTGNAEDAIAVGPCYALYYGANPMASMKYSLFQPRRPIQHYLDRLVRSAFVRNRQEEL